MEASDARGSGASAAAAALLSPSHAYPLEPPLRWGEVYDCYAGPARCGPQMKALWDRGERERLHILNGLVHVLRGWCAASRAADEEEALALITEQRQRRVGANIDQLIAELGGEWQAGAGAGAARSRVEETRAALRELREAIRSLAQV